MGIKYLDGRRLRAALLAGCEAAQRGRAELNRINVFPVPDGDTGTNLALTTSAIADGLRPNRDRHVGVVAQAAAEAAILGARGNCGMILSHWLLGFAQEVRGQARLLGSELATALGGAAQHVYGALERPVEGTILTVMRETADEAEGAPGTDMGELAERLLSRARSALERTPDYLPALRAAGVVDAGAKGFVHLLEGVVALVHGEHAPAPEASSENGAPAVARAEFSVAEQYRFCTEALVRGPSLPACSEVRGRLEGRGDSLIVITSGEVLKIHIHTDEPEAVFGYLRTLGQLATHKAEDMKVQHDAVERAAAAHVQLARRPIVVVADSGCDLPEEQVRAHGIHLVPLLLIYGDEVLRDRIDIDAETFVERLRRSERATTSQPPPAAFLEAYGRAAQDGEEIIAVILSSALSGTFSSAEAAAKRFEGAPVHLVDSRGASLLAGLQVLRAVELAELGWDPPRIVRELERVRAQSGLFFTVDRFENLLASGRVSRSAAYIGGLLAVKPILELDADGLIRPLTKTVGRANVRAKVLRLLAERVPVSARCVRFGIVHVGCPDVAARLAAEIRRRYGDRDILIAPASPVLATHLGPDAWGLGYQIED